MDKTTQRRFYVYALFRETGLPFYIGKGCGNRWERHERHARCGIQSHKCAIIRDIQLRGFAVIRVKLHEGLTETVAHAYEIALIKAIGRGDGGPLVNHTSGGDGVSGLKFSLETRAKMSTAHRGKKMSPESIAKGVETRRGLPRRKLSPERVANLVEANRGKKRSTEARIRMSAAQRGRRLSAEARAHLSAVKRGSKASPETRVKLSMAQRASSATMEHIAKLAVTRRGTKCSAETRAKMSMVSLGRQFSAETRARISLANRGKKRSAETRAKLSAAKCGKPKSPESIAKRSATRRANNERRRTETLDYTNTVGSHGPTGLM